MSPVDFSTSGGIFNHEPLSATDTAEVAPAWLHKVIEAIRIAPWDADTHDPDQKHCPHCRLSYHQDEPDHQTSRQCFEAMSLVTYRLRRQLIVLRKEFDGFVVPPQDTILGINKTLVQLWETIDRLRDELRSHEKELRERHSGFKMLEEGEDLPIATSGSGPEPPTDSEGYASTLIDALTFKSLLGLLVPNPETVTVIRLEVERG